MKSIIILLISCSLWACNSAQNAEEKVADQNQQTDPHANNGGAIAFETDFHDFGKITSGEVVSQVFKFTNKGTGPLVISHVQVSCGCTSPEYTREPVAPGAEGNVTLSFNSSGFHGTQNKQVVITTDGEPKEAKLNFTAQVE
jgi:hypothetical protein